MLQGVLRDCARNDTQTLKPAEPRIRKIIAGAIRGPARWVDFAVWLYRYRTPLGFAAAVAQITNEFLTCVELCARRLVSIEIAYQTNAERDVVQIIAVHMTAVDLAPPSIADFDSGRCRLMCRCRSRNDRQDRSASGEHARW